MACITPRSTLTYPPAEAKKSLAEHRDTNPSLGVIPSILRIGGFEPKISFGSECADYNAAGSANPYLWITNLYLILEILLFHKPYLVLYVLKSLFCFPVFCFVNTEIL